MSLPRRSSSSSGADGLPPPLPLLVPTPRTSEPLDGTGNDTWLFSPPALRRPSGRTSSIAAFFQQATLPPLQKSYPMPETKDGRRRQYRVPFVLFACFAVFAILAGVLVFGSRDSDSASEKTATNITVAPVAPTTATPAPTAMLEAVEITEEANASGMGDGTNVPWKFHRYYFVNNCTEPLHIYQKPVNMTRWGFCDLAVGTYGCAGNETGASYHTPAASLDQATLFEVAVVGSTVSYDISVIPPGCGHEMSLAGCKARSGKIGFNLPMRVTPLQSTCPTLTCLEDGCVDAYHYPDEPNKTRVCMEPTATFQVTFCPSP
ncbi:hypothetical protein ACHHYP_03516 [Achlya hypogyna]|uniref:Uncharacterized protein n=1 Tax=Achlya hypogyna TaxID=1202772 RepID=A0A1V9Z3N1_ACHHY|nr:hypothetical protein ACHHYP_03516 [Achlya hypogyna]